MRRIFQPFRENVPAGRCVICGETIFTGDVAYFVFGYSCCYGCIDRSAYVADGTGESCDNIGEHLLGIDGCVKEGKGG